MSNTIRREVPFPQPREQVWQSITHCDALADWMFPNDFEPRVGHQSRSACRPNPAVGFDGLTVRCEVLECEAPSRLVFSWCVAGPVADTRVSFRLEPEGDGTRLYFEHTGFDLSRPEGAQTFHGAEFGWAKMLGQLADVVAARASDRA